MKFPARTMVPDISKEIRSCLDGFCRSRTLPKYLVLRSEIILMAADGASNRQIAEKLGLHRNTVSLWRMRFVVAMPILLIAAGEYPDEMEELIRITLSDEMRSGRPARYGPDLRCLVKTIACQNPEDYGFVASHWSLSLIRLALIQGGVSESISIGTIYHILITDDIKPWKNHYYLHSKEKYESPETYEAKVRAVNGLYHEAVSRRGSDDDADTVIYSCDEMTGVQALEREYEGKPTAPGMTAKTEFNYIRHGTTSLIGFLNVTTGKMADPFLNRTRTAEDYVSALSSLWATVPEGKKLCIVCDNLNIHQSEELVRYVAGLSNITELGEKGKSGILKSKATRAEFLSNTEHKICFYYVPIHCSWLNQIEIWFGIINRQLLRRKSFKSVEDLEKCICAYIEQYNKFFAHPFNWKYNGVPGLC